MDRVKKLKVKKTDGSFTDYIPIGADAMYIDMADGDNLQEEINTINNKLDEMTEDGTLSEIITNCLKNSRREILDSEIFAQLIPNIDYENNENQCFAIGNNILFSCWNNPTDNTNCLILTYNIITGELLKCINNLSLGHCNDVTYCEKDGYFYIACGGGTDGLNKIKVFDENINYIKEIDFTNKIVQNPYGIAYNNKKDLFYLLGNSNSIYTMDYNFENVIKSSNLIEQNKSTIQQTIFFDGNFIYNIKNISNDIQTNTYYNKFDLYDTNLVYNTSQYLTILNEVESACFYNNEIYVSKFSSKRGLIYKTSSIQNQNIYKYINNNFIFKNVFPIYGGIENIYVDSNYNGFFINGTNSKPFSDIITALSNSYMSTSRYIIYLKGDFSNTDLTIQKFYGELTIIGEDNKTKIGGLCFKNTNRININNLEITRRNQIDNNLLTISNCQYIYMDNIDFNGKGTEDRAINSINSACNLRNVNFLSSVNINIFAFYDNSVVRFTGSVSINDLSKPPYYATSVENSLWYQPPIDTLKTDETWRVTILGGGITFKLADITKNGSYRVEGGNTVSDAPGNLQTNGIKFSVFNNNNVITYFVSNYQGTTLYIGIKSPSSDTIKWNNLIT